MPNSIFIHIPETLEPLLDAEDFTDNLGLYKLPRHFVLAISDLRTDNLADVADEHIKIQML